MEQKYHQLFRDAFDNYLHHLDSSDLEPQGQLLPYDFEFLENRKWHGLAESLIKCDLRELTNLINRWNMSLCRWHAWNLVLQNRDEDSAWSLREEFLEALAHECLLRPSSVRDTFTSVATNGLHQVRLSTEQTYRDYLEGEPTTPTEKPKNLRRSQKERRLKHLTEKWPEATAFIECLRELDTTEYKTTTCDYRNLNSHTIGPRLGIGDTRIVTRSVTQATQIESVGNGKFDLVPVPGKMAVSYGLGGTPPLDLENARIENLKQYMLARDCYDRYRHLLEVAVNEIETIRAPA